MYEIFKGASLRKGPKESQTAFELRFIKHLKKSEAEFEAHVERTTTVYENDSCIAMEQKLGLGEYYV